MIQRFVIHGRVQGVGYRYWAVAAVERMAEAGLPVRGWVRNRLDGTVEILAIGEAALLEDLADACADGPPSAKVTEVERLPAEDDGSTGFRQRPTV
jgi:acylphosphatase